MIAVANAAGTNSNFVLPFKIDRSRVLLQNWIKSSSKISFEFRGAEVSDKEEENVPDGGYLPPMNHKETTNAVHLQSIVRHFAKRGHLEIANLE